MGQKQPKNEVNEKKSVNISVTFDKAIWEVIDSSPELGKSDSGKVTNICVSWLSEHGILSGTIKKRLGIQ